MIKQQNIIAKKHLGQNFLRNKNILDAIIDFETLVEKNIVEIGPGPGDLTERLLSKNPKTLTVIEIDADMIPLLHQRFGDAIQIYHQDVLNIDINQNFSPNDSIIMIPDSYHVFGNIPYYITSPILMHFLYTISHPPLTLTITMQKEVADRILARDEKHSVLSLACQLVADVKKICDIHPNNFDPVPKVWSTCLRFDLKSTDTLPYKTILTLIKQGFSQKRKKLSSNLKNLGYTNTLITEAFQGLDIPDTIRAEDLTLEQWKILAQKIL